MRCLLIGALLGASFSVAAAGEPAKPAGASTEQAADAAEHLRSAAEHLDEAGFSEQAARLRDSAAQLLAEAHDALLERKLAESEALRAEIADLRRRAGRESQVVLRVTVLEIDRDKVLERGVDWLGMPGAAAGVIGPGIATVLDAAESESLLAHVEWLRQNELARVLAEPTLVTLSGRPAYFNIGGEFPIPAPQADGGVSVEFKKFGTRVEFVAIELGGGALRLEVRARVSELDPARDVRIGSLTVPGLNVREVDTGAELERGQMLVIGGLIHKRVETEEICDDDHDDPFTAPVEPRHTERTSMLETVVIVQPQLIDIGPNKFPAPQARRNRPALNAVDAPRTLPQR